MTPQDRLTLAEEAPLARAAFAVSMAGIVFGIIFIPQLLGMALGGLSLARREEEGRRFAVLAIVISLVLVVVWGIVLSLLIKWWANR